jgi:hypothetical protein
MITTPFDEEGMIEKLKSADKYGMLGWYLRGTGADESPFSELRQNHPGTWEKLKLEIAY